MSSINLSPDSLLRADIIATPEALASHARPLIRDANPQRAPASASVTGYGSLNTFNNNNRNLNQNNTVLLTGIDLLRFQNSLNASSETSSQVSALLPQASQESREALRRLFK